MYLYIYFDLNLIANSNVVKVHLEYSKEIKNSDNGNNKSFLYLAHVS